MIHHAADTTLRDSSMATLRGEMTTISGLRLKLRRLEPKIATMKSNATITAPKRLPEVLAVYLAVALVLPSCLRRLILNLPLTKNLRYSLERPRERARAITTLSALRRQSCLPFGSIGRLSDTSTQRPERKCTIISRRQYSRNVLGANSVFVFPVDFDSTKSKCAMNPLPGTLC